MRRVTAVGLFALFVLTGLAGIAAAPARCTTTPSIRNAAAGYDAGSTMTIDYTNTCSPGTITLRWPSGLLVRQWTVTGSGGSLTYRIAPYALTGTWTAEGTSGRVSSTTVRPVNLPATGRMRQLGEDEVVVTDYTQEASLLRFHDFRGTYSAGAWSTLGTSASRVDVGDVDGDGVDEVVMVSAWSDKTKYVHVSEVGTPDRDPIAWPRWAFLSGNTPEDVAVGDYNGDGREEIAILYYATGAFLPNRWVGVWTAWGASFGPGYTFEIPNSAYVHRLAAGDVNADGRDEAVFSTDWAYDLNPLSTDFWIGYVDFARARVERRQVVNTIPVVDIATVRDDVGMLSKIVAMRGGFARFFTVDLASGTIIDDPAHAGWVQVGPFSVMDDAFRAIAAGDQDGDGVEEIFTLALYGTGSIVWSYNLRTGAWMNWATGRVQGDLGTRFADIAAGDVNGDGPFVYPTGVVRHVPEDAAIVARVGTPPYPTGVAADKGEGHFGETYGGGHTDGASTTFEGGVGVTVQVGGSWTGVEGDIKVMIGYSHTETETDSWENRMEISQRSLETGDTLIVAKTTYDVYEYRVFNRDMNHDGVVDDRDVIFLDTNRETRLSGVSVAGWNQAPWTSFRSWVHLPETSAEGWHVAGDPVSYRRGCPAPSEVMWVPRTSQGNCLWDEVTDATLDYDYTESTTTGMEIVDEVSVSADFEIKVATGFGGAGAAFSFGYRHATLMTTSTTTGFTVGVRGPRLDPTRPDYLDYTYDFVPTLALQSIHHPLDDSVVQSFFVLDYAVDHFGTGYGFPGAPGKPTWNPPDERDGIFAVSWSPAPGGRGGGIKEYEVQEQVDDGAWRVVAVTSGPAYATPYRPPATYRYQVRAHDYEGNWGPLSPTSDPIVVPWDLRVTNDPGVSTGPAIAVDSLGNYHLVWSDTRTQDGNSEIYYQELNPDWDSLVPAARLTVDGASSVEPAIVVSPGGVITVAWSDSRDGNFEIYTRTKLPSLGWGPESRLTSDASDSKEPDVALDEWGNLHYLWRDVVRPPAPAMERERIMYQQNGDPPLVAYEMSGSPLSYPHADRLVSPRIAVGGLLSGTSALHGVFSEGPSYPYEAGVSHLYYIRWTAVDWGNPIELGTDVDSPRRISVDADGGAHVYAAWEGYLGDFGVRFRKSDDGGSTWGPVQFLGAAGSHQITPDVAAGPNGNVYIVWADNSRGQYEIEFVVNARSGQAGYWTAPSQLTDSPQDSLRPRIAIGLATWKVGVVWRDFRDLNWEVYFTAKYV